MPETGYESCRQIFAEHEDNDKLADLLEARHPGGACERYSVGLGSPGPVQAGEQLLRIIISPRDFDPETSTILARPFEKVFGNGLSVCRELATDEHVCALVRDGLLGSPERKVLNICQAAADDVRAMQDESCERVFCIYDQTVTRNNPTEEPVPTHAGIFGRRPPPKVASRRKIQKDFAGRLRELFISRQIPLTEFREGLLA